MKHLTRLLDLEQSWLHLFVNNEFWRTVAADSQILYDRKYWVHVTRLEPCCYPGSLLSMIVHDEKVCFEILHLGFGNVIGPDGHPQEQFIGNVFDKRLHYRLDPRGEKLLQIRS